MRTRGGESISAGRAEKMLANEYCVLLFGRMGMCGHLCGHSDRALCTRIWTCVYGAGICVATVTEHCIYEGMRTYIS